MNNYKLTFEYHTNGSHEIIMEKTINIDLEEFENSYKHDVSKMEQKYSKSEINKHIRPAKEQFIYDCISKNLGSNQELDSLIDPLVDKIDKYIIES